MTHCGVQWWLRLWEEDVISAVHTGHFLNSADGDAMVKELLGEASQLELDFEAGAVDFSSIDFGSQRAAPMMSETADEWALRLEREAAEKSEEALAHTQSAPQEQADEYVARLEAEAVAKE